MHFLFIKLSDITYKEEVILALQSVGVTRASCIESTNLERALSDELTLFRGFFKSEAANEGQQLIFTALIEQAAQAKEIITNLKEAGIDLENEDILRLIVMPVTLVFDSSLGFLDFT